MLEADGDMLLFQRGPHEWWPEPPSFQYNITRQFIEDFQDGEMWQLDLTAH